MDTDYLNDKRWMYAYKTKPARCHPRFVAGVNFFIDYARERLGVQGNGLMRCPCRKCENGQTHDCETIKTHIVLQGFFPLYETWSYHGEGPQNQSDINVPSGHGEEMGRMLGDAFMHNMEQDSALNDPDDAEVQKFQKLLEEAKRPLYGGCQKYSKLSFMVHLFQIKCLNRWSNKSFSDVVSLLKDALPPDNLLPRNWYESKKTMADLGLSYEKIHACSNDCILYRNDFKELDKCPRCGSSRWAVKKKGRVQTASRPAKVLRHFPLVPRLQRLFMSNITSEFMTWHGSAPATEAGKMIHPRDSAAWKHFDKL